VRRENARKGGHQKVYNRRSRESAKDKKHLRELAKKVELGEFDTEKLKAIKGAYDTVTTYLRIESEDYRQYVLVPELLEHENDNP